MAFLDGGNDLVYAIDESDPERQRLLGEALAFATKGLVEQIGLIAGSRCLDIGCGIGGATRILAKRVGPDGECIGLDLDHALLHAAVSSDWCDVNISFIQGDATDLPFDDNSFDLAHARYLFIHLQNQPKAISEMARVTKTGGVVALCEPDFRAISAYPDSWAYEALPGILAKAYADSLVGRKLIALLRSAGCKHVKAYSMLGLEYEGTLAKRLIRLTFEATARGLVKKGEMTQDEFERMDKEFHRVEDDESICILTHPGITAWGIV
jgi:ubiquinone/menaquinone biosynthesis C-methylase UbiE